MKKAMLEHDERPASMLRQVGFDISEDSGGRVTPFVPAPEDDEGVAVWGVGLGSERDLPQSRLAGKRFPDLEGEE